MSRGHTCFLLYPDCQSLDVTGPFEVFTGANRHLESRGERPFYRLLIAGSTDAPVRTESGLCLVAERALADVRGPIDTLVVPGGNGARAAEKDSALVAAVARLAGKARRIVGVCTGSFLLASAGLLDGRRATTHWAFCSRLARRYDNVSVEADPIFVRDGHVYTSAGVTAGIDLALALVEEDLGRDVALTIARWLVLFLRRPANQRQFSVQLESQIAERSPLRAAQTHAADHLAEDLSVECLARQAAMSPRNFARSFKQEVGVTPGAYVANLRLEAARRLLEDGDQSVDAVAARCGFGTAETMRRRFIKQLGVAPSEYRRRFHAATFPSAGGKQHATVHPDL